MPIGSISALIAESTDAVHAGITPVDGESGATDFPHGNLKVLATVGEYNEQTGYMLVGVPDGMGAYLIDDETVRLVFQSESYGTISRYEAYPVIVNDNGASFTGSHIMYVDYDRAMLSTFMENGDSAAGMVKGSGEVVKNAYNLDGNMIGKRPFEGCAEAPHYSNTDPNGCGEWSGIMDVTEPSNGVDWIMQSLCSAHLEEVHQWGEGLGVEDDLFITNEEWTEFVPGTNFTGIPVHVVDLATHDLYACGVFTLGGFEKIVEFNCGHPDYVCFSPSGYNGAFFDGRHDVKYPIKEGVRPSDGMNYTWPQDVVPARIYIGKKGYNASGMPATDFLSRNGLAYGQLYGFGTELNLTTDGLDRDAWHKAEGRTTGDSVEGAFYSIPWRWDGVVKPFVEDGSWDFQVDPAPGINFWNAAGNDASGKKTEHNSPDPYGNPRFVQGSTAGYMGIYDLTGILDAITTADAADEFPTMIPATYHNLQGEVSIVSQVVLGGQGMYAHGGNATMNYDNPNDLPGEGTATFEDIDGLEWFAAAGSDLGYILIQEDSGNDYGERMFITPVSLTEPLTYYLVAISGGPLNTRMLAGVGIPAGTNSKADSHEFSGTMDMSGILAKNPDGSFVCSAGDGYCKRQQEALVPINDKIIGIGLQAHNLFAGLIETFKGDRGGQVYAYKPSLP